MTRSRPRRLPLFLLALSIASAAAWAEDWPHYRGPERSGTAGDSDLMAAWGEAGPAVVWRQPIGAGFSAVSVVGDRVYTMGLEGDQDVVLSLDAATGKTVWQTTVGPTKADLFPDGGPRSTPAVSDGRVFAVSTEARLVALDAATGELIWDQDLTAWGGRAPRFGYSMSPLVDGGQVLLDVGAMRMVEAEGEEEPRPEPIEGKSLAAFDAATGELRWTALTGPMGYSSVVPITLAGEDQYLLFRFDAIVGLGRDGEVAWSHDIGRRGAIPMPLFLPPDRVFVATAEDDFGGLMIRVTRDGDGFRTEEVWNERLMRNHFNTSVAVGGHVYGFDNATFKCLDADTGKRCWAKRGFGKGSLVAAGDLLYVLGDDGTVALVRATPDAYTELGRTRATEGRAWTEPTLANGRLYVRDADEIVSLDVRGGEDAAAVAASPSAPATADRASAPGASDLTVDQVIARHVAARGGVERWHQLQGLEMTGRYAAFSVPSDFSLVRKKGDQYRLDFEMLGGPAIRARDAEGPWGQHALLQPEAGRITEDPYKSQLERESLFGLLLLDHAEKGIGVELAGPADVGGTATVSLAVTLPGGAKETWFLDAESFLEVAIDSEVQDFTQGPNPMRQRQFFGDFREVEGLLLPHQISWEFGARLEEMTVETVAVDPEINPQRLAAPAQQSADEGADDAGSESRR